MDRPSIDRLIAKDVQAVVHLLWVWHAGDPLPEQMALPGLILGPAAAADALADAARLPVAEVTARRQRGNQPYRAVRDGQLVAYGWSCFGTAECGSRALPFAVAPGDRYLWDFATRPGWRGQGIYPRLLQAILRTESTAQRFWIMHRADNRASGHGIAKAGFRLAAALYDRPDGRFRVASVGSAAAARRAALAFADLVVAQTAKRGAA